MTPLRGITASPLRALPQIGDGKPKETENRDTTRQSKSDTSTYAWMSFAKFLPTGGISRTTKTFGSSYVSGFSSYSDFYGALSADFGPGQKKTYQTVDGPKDLYEYQYNNLLKYGDIRGPVVRSDFSFKDGRWWTTRMVRNDYDKFSDPGLDPVLRKYDLTADESELVYSIAQQRNLTKDQYSNLQKTVLARKYFSGIEKDMAYWSKILTTPEALNTGYNKSVSEGAIFGSSSELKNFASSLQNFARATELLASMSGASSGFPGAMSNLSGAYLSGGGKPGGMFDSLSDLEGSATGGLVSGALSFLGNVLFPALWGTGEQKRAGLKPWLKSIGDFFEFAFTWQYKLSDAVVSHLKHKKKKYWLTNSSGKIIDSYADMTDAADKRDIAEIASSAGVSVDTVASYLGMYYRKRIIDNLSPLLDSYATMLSSKSYFSGLQTPSF